MWQIIQQSETLALFERSILECQLSHAYLFVGPPRVGKCTLAINLAQAVNCKEKDAPCGKCGSCCRISSGKHADIKITGLISEEKKEIGIDQIKEIQVSSSLPPFEGIKKIFIIDNADLLSHEASNCLLKTLEELPHYAIIILLTANEKMLLPTITSRCQRVELRPVPLDFMKTVLIRQENRPEPEIDMIARLSGGCPGWAKLALQDENLLLKRNHRLNMLTDLITAGRKRRLGYADELATLFSKNRGEVEETIEFWGNWWHDLLLLKYGNDKFITNVDQRPALFEHGKNFSIIQIKRFIQSLQTVRDQLEQNINPRLALELLVLNMP